MMLLQVAQNITFSDSWLHELYSVLKKSDMISYSTRSLQDSRWLWVACTEFSDDIYIWTEKLPTKLCSQVFTKLCTLIVDELLMLANQQSTNI